MIKIDSRTLLGEFDGFRVVVDMVADEDASCEDDEGLTAAQLGAYRAGDWSYVGLVVRAYREGVELGSASLWGIEAGSYVVTDEADNVLERRWLDPINDSEYVDELVVEAVAEARATLARLCASV